ncbi:MAG: hypothetical protein V3W44_04220 [Dehalococcoidales bacterium]
MAKTLFGDVAEEQQAETTAFGDPIEGTTAVVDVPDLDDIDEALKANIPPDYEDRIRNSLHYTRALSLNPEAAFDLEPQLNEQLFGTSTLSENPAVLFKDAFVQSLAEKPAMMLKGLEVYTPGRALGIDTLLDKSATFLQELNDPEKKQALQEVASGKLWPTGEDRRWWQVEARHVPEVINTWAVNVADQIPIMLATMAGRIAGKAIGKPLGAAAVLVTGGPDPSDVATAPAVVAITSEITKHLGGAAPLIAMEAGNFMDEAGNLEIDRDIAEKYAKPYSLGSGAIEYAQNLWLLGRYSKITAAAQQSILRQVLGHIGGSLFQGVEELSQQGLQNFLMQKAVADMKERHPDYQGEAPEITEGLKRSGQIGAGVAFITGLPGTGMSIADGAATRMRDISPETKKFLGEPSVQEQLQPPEKAPTEPAKPSEAAPPVTVAEPGVEPVAVEGVEPTVPVEAAPAGEVAKPEQVDTGGEIIDRAIREDLIEKFVKVEGHREGVKSQLVQELAEVTGLNPNDITDLSPKGVGDLIDIGRLPESQQETIRNLVTDYGDATEKLQKLQTERNRIDAPRREFEAQPAPAAEEGKVRVVQDDETIDLTEAAREEFDRERREVQVARFSEEEDVILYRGVSQQELDDIKRTGQITGGTFSTPFERKFGAQFAATPEEARRAVFHSEEAKGVEGQKRFVISVNAKGKLFGHEAPQFEVTPQRTVIDKSRITGNLGVSIKATESEILNIQEVTKPLTAREKQAQPAPAAEEGKAIFTSTPVEWTKVEKLQDRGTKGLRAPGSPTIGGRKSFIWSSEFTEVPVRLPPATMKAFKARTDEVFKVQNFKGDDYWLVPTRLHDELRESLGESAFKQRPKPERSAKQQLNDHLLAMLAQDKLDEVEIGAELLKSVEFLGLTRDDLSPRMSKFVEVHDEQAIRTVHKDVPPGVGEKVLTEEQAERLAIQEESEASEIGDFLDGLEDAALAEVKPPSKKKLPKEPTKLREDVTGILGGLAAQEAAGLTRAEIEHLAPNQQRALRAAQKRGLRVGFKQGVAETITDARRTMGALITKRNINEKNKMDLASIVLTYVPKRDQGRFIRRILDLKTPKQARQLTGLIREAAEGLIERQAVRDAKKALSEQISRIPRFGRRMKLRGPAVQKIKDALATLPGDAIAELEAAELRKGRRLDPLSLKKLSKKKKTELEAIRDELKEVGFAIEDKFKVPDPEEMGGIEALVGEKVLIQLHRLQTDSIAKMTSEEINSIADAIRYALDQDSKQTKERLAETKRRRQAERSAAKVEITHTKAAGKIDTAERGIPISLPKRVYNFFFQDSLHRWALVESATSNTETTTARVLDQDIHKGKTKKLDKEFESLEALWAEMDRLGWSQADFDRVDQEHIVTLGGKKYKLTTAEIMSLGMNAKSDRNAKQIVRAVSLKIAGRTVKTPTMGEIVDAMEVLTDKEIAVMDFLPALNENVLMPAINEVSEDMLGLILAVDRDYWGLKRQLGRTVRGRTVAGPAIEDQGPFQPFLGSKIQLGIVSFWNQLLTQIQTASSLHGMAQPMEAARSLLNDGTDRPGYTSWQTVMDNMGRRREKENLLTIFERTQGVASDRDNVDIVGSTLLARAAKAILGWRVSTMAIQAASYPMAFTVVPKQYAKPLAGVKVQRGAAQSKRINEFSPFLRMRHIGGRTSIVTGDAAAANAVDTLIFRQPGDKSLNGMRRVDRRTIEEIDVNVQRWVADTTKLKVGGKAYWQEVAKRTDEAARKTQPMWDVDERSVLASTPNVVTRSFFIFRSAREAVYNQNLMAVDRYMKARDKGAAKKELANTLAMTTISTVMVVGIGLALRKSISALFAAITGRKAPDEEKEPKEKATGFLIDVLETGIEYAPLGRLGIGLGNLALRNGRWADVDPDAILFGGPVALAKGGGHLTEAYEAYFEDGDQEKLKVEMVAAFNDMVDGIARLKGIPAGGILQLTTQPLERALKQEKERKPFTITRQE